MLKAKKEKRLILADFSARWCPGCVRLENEVLGSREFKKLTGDDATPLTPEAQEKAIKEIPREPEIIAVFNKVAGSEPLPAR